MRFAHHYLRRKGCQPFEGNFRVGHVQVVGDGHIDLRTVQPLYQAFLVVLDLRHLDIRVHPRKSLAQLRRNHGRKRCKAANPQGATEKTLCVVGNVIQGTDLLKQIAHLLDDLVAHWRDRQALRVMAHEQGNGKLGFDLRDGR
ncbi:hypothetical protein D3C72_1244960 [compost metagenome]